MTDLKAAMWVHGNVAEVEFRDRLASTELLPVGVSTNGSLLEGSAVFGNVHRFAGGSQHLQDKDDNWFHFPMPTPVILDDLRPPLRKFFVFYSGKLRNNPGSKSRWKH